MNYTTIKAVLPPLCLACILSLVFLLPKHDKLMDASISPDMPLAYALPGWRGVKLQESELERNSLAADTRFSKAAYTKLRNSPDEPRGPEIVASIVYSGNDMNASIHRPERCLPSQGHVDLQGRQADITLSDGSRITFTRLASRTPGHGPGKPPLQHINYYIFVGHDSILSTHMGRTLRDMSDRVLHGYVQRWAYYQIGTYWGGETGISEDLADSRLRRLIAELTPCLIDRESMKNKSKVREGVF